MSWLGFFFRCCFGGGPLGLLAGVPRVSCCCTARVSSSVGGGGTPKKFWSLVFFFCARDWSYRWLAQEAEGSSRGRGVLGSISRHTHVTHNTAGPLALCVLFLLDVGPADQFRSDQADSRTCVVYMEPPRNRTLEGVCASPETI